MDEPYRSLVLVSVGVVAGFMNVVAFGGSMIVVPTLIFLGLPASVANGTNRIALLFQGVSAVRSFHGEDVAQIRLSLRLGLCTVPGAVCGAWVGATVDDILFQRILAVIMIGAAIWVLARRGRVATTLESDETRAGWPVYLALLGIGFYGGFVQIAVGLLLMITLAQLMKMSLVYVNLHKVTIVLIYTLPTIAVYAATGNIRWITGMYLGVGTALGGWWGAKVTVRKGETLIKIVMCVAITVMALRLLFLPQPSGNP